MKTTKRSIEWHEEQLKKFKGKLPELEEKLALLADDAGLTVEELMSLACQHYLH